MISLVAPPGRLEDIVAALRSVMRPAQRDRGCTCARMCQGDDQRIWYVEEWVDADVFERQMASDRITRLLAVLEMAADVPSVEFRFIRETRGLEYIDAARRAFASNRTSE